MGANHGSLVPDETASATLRGINGKEIPILIQRARKRSDLVFDA